MYRVSYLHHEAVPILTFSWDGTVVIEASESAEDCVKPGQFLGLSSDNQERFFEVEIVNGVSITIKDDDALGIPVSDGFETARHRLDVTYTYPHPQSVVSVKVFAADPQKPQAKTHLEDLMVGDCVCIGGFCEPHPQLGVLPPNRVLSIEIVE